MVKIVMKSYFLLMMKQNYVLVMAHKNEFPGFELVLACGGFIEIKV
jgi:hypothetical protein